MPSIRALGSANVLQFRPFVVFALLEMLLGTQCATLGSRNYGWTDLEQKANLG